MNKHTPGPWNIRRIGKSRTIVEIGPICADEYAGSCWIDVSESDASIACAAPDLLEAAQLALQIAESWIHDQLDGTSSIDGALLHLDSVRSAIARARGEA